MSDILPPWLTILGVGDNGLESLTPVARTLLSESKVVIAPERVLADIPETTFAGMEVIPWTSRVHETIRNLKERRGEQITILSTGDPMHYGIGATMARHIPVEEIVVVPTPSGFSLAASKLGWTLQDVDCTSIHGRAVSRLQPFIQPGNRILSLTSTGKTIGEAAKLLVDRGFGESKLTVLEHINGKDERTVELLAQDVSDQTFADFNMLAIECVASENAQILPRIPGLPNDAFSHDGQLTKREVRAATLAALAPYPDALLWDIGAGCGSVAIEWMRSARGAKAICFERNEKRLSMIAENAAALGTPLLQSVAGDVSTSLEDQPTPDAIFIGGGLTSEGVFDTAWEQLRIGGVLVANTVTLEGEAELIALQSKHGGELVRLDISHLTNVGQMRALEPRMSVLQWQVRKPS